MRRSNYDKWILEWFERTFHTFKQKESNPKASVLSKKKRRFIAQVGMEDNRNLTEYQKSIELAAGMPIDWSMANAAQCSPTAWTISEQGGRPLDELINKWRKTAKLLDHGIRKRTLEDCSDDLENWQCNHITAKKV